MDTVCCSYGTNIHMACTNIRFDYRYVHVVHLDQKSRRHDEYPWGCYTIIMLLHHCMHENINWPWLKLLQRFSFWEIWGESLCDWICLRRFFFSGDEGILCRKWCQKTEPVKVIRFLASNIMHVYNLHTLVIYIGTQYGVSIELCLVVWTKSYFPCVHVVYSDVAEKEIAETKI